MTIREIVPLVFLLVSVYSTWMTISYARKGQAFPMGAFFGVGAALTFLSSIVLYYLLHHTAVL